MKTVDGLEELKCTMTIEFNSDGDFGFSASDLEWLKEEYGWEVYTPDDDYQTVFILKDFVGTRIGLISNIMGIFRCVRTSKIYVMRFICDMFEEMSNKLRSNDLTPVSEMYFDGGNYEATATIDFGPASQLDTLNAEIKYKEQWIERQKNAIAEMETVIAGMKNTAKALEEEVKNGR